jgi:hypothetical protein
MNRRTVLRTLGVGVAGFAGCAEVPSSGSEITANDDTTTSETTTLEPLTTTREAQTGTHREETTTATDGCPPSVVPEDRRHVHSDYGLGIVRAETERPAVAIVGEDWESELRTEAMSEEDETFVTETDFEQSVVFVVQYMKSSSSTELRITDYEFDEQTLRVELCVVTHPGPSDAPTTNLFARLDHSGGVPSTVEARISRGTESMTVSDE